MRTRTKCLLLLVAAAAASGCVTSLNDEPFFSDGSPIDTVLEPASQGGGYTQPDAPSLTGLDRSAWPVTNVLVAQRDIVHQPTYRSRRVAFADSSATQRGEYPTPQTAGEDISDGSRGEQILEALVEPLQVIGDTVLLIPRAILTPLWTPTRGPMAPVQRVPPQQSATATPAAATPPTQPPDAPPPVDPITDAPSSAPPASPPPVTTPSPTPTEPRS